MMNVDDLQKDVQLVLDSMRSFVEAASDLTWSPSDGFLPVIYRSILRRQFDSLDAISHLVAQKRGDSAITLLRPSCEELIWIKYLASIAATDAEKLIVNITDLELINSLKAQDDYGGRTVTKELGLLPFIERANRRKGVTRERLGALGKKLDWDSRTIQNRQPPNLKWLAQKTGQSDVYNFIYRATSRFVHFSGAELLRRAWGKPGSISIRSVHFRDYWGSFALHWGLRLFLDSAAELCSNGSMPEEGLNEETVLSAAERIGAYGQVPIITAEELAWPE